VLTSSHRSFYKLIRTIQQLYQHQINTKSQKLETNLIIQSYYTNKFRQIIHSFQSFSLEEYLLNLIEYLPI